MELKDHISPVWDQLLGALDGMLKKAEDAGRGDDLLAARIAGDMFPLATQVRFVCNMPGEAMERLGLASFASNENDPATIAEAHTLIADTRAQLAEWAKIDFPADDQQVELALGNGMTFDLTVGEYLRDWALAQFYFHITAAYMIMRKEGVALGKAEFVPYMFKYLRQPASA